MRCGLTRKKLTKNKMQSGPFDHQPPLTVTNVVVDQTGHFAFYFYRVSFVLGHLAFYISVAFNIATARVVPHNWIAISSIVLASLVLGIPIYKFLKGVYYYIIIVFTYFWKYQGTATVITACLHHLMVIQLEEMTPLQLMFACHVFSFVCYLRAIAKGDPSGCVQAFVGTLGQTAVYFFVKTKSTIATLLI